MNIKNKILKLIYISIALITIVSCNNRKKGRHVKDITFDFCADVVMEKDDDLILYFRDGSNEWFDEQHSVWVHLKGSNNIQSVKFSLPKGILPNHLRFDFSKNPKQLPVKILKIKVNYLNHSFELKEKQILSYFDINECVIFNANKKTYKPIRDSKGIYDPYMLINEKFYTEMDKVIMGN